MKITRFAGVLGTLALGLVGAFALASPAQAADIQAANAWVANPDSVILGPTEVKLSGPNTSVETTDLDHPIQSQHQISFTYQLLDGAVCGAGAPRVFVEIDGVFVNSWDGNQCGTENDDGTTFTVTFTAGKNGRVGAMGVVFDQSGGYVEGSVVVSNLTINGESVLFTSRPEQSDDCSAYIDSDVWCQEVPKDDGYEQDRYNCDEIADEHKPIELVDQTNDPFGLDGDGDGLACESEDETDGDQDGSGDQTGNGDDQDDNDSAAAGDQLPLTGAGLLPVAAVGGAFAVVGVVAYLVTRRRRITFTA